MKIPPHYSVSEVIAALEKKITEEEEYINNTKDRIKSLNEPKLEPRKFLGRFGFKKKVYTSLTYIDMLFSCIYFTRENIYKNDRKIEALKKLPADMRVSLSIDEINDLFP